jgi:hypothetical protein
MIWPNSTRLRRENKGRHCPHPSNARDSPVFGLVRCYHTKHGGRYCQVNAEDVIRGFPAYLRIRTSISLYHRHRLPSEITKHCVWLYFRFALSFRDVEEMLAMPGVSLSYETVREWCRKFGQTYTNSLRPGERWHLDEVFL